MLIVKVTYNSIHEGNFGRFNRDLFRTNERKTVLVSNNTKNGDPNVIHHWHVCGRVEKSHNNSWFYFSNDS